MTHHDGRREISARLERIAQLCAPVPVEEFFNCLRAAGFMEAAYFPLNSGLKHESGEPNSDLLHFCESGILEGRRFQAKLSGRGLAAELAALAALPIQNQHYAAMLIAGFGRAWMRELWREGREQIPEFCDIFPDSDLATIMDLRAYGARPFFVLGDSHSRLYARMWRILPDATWLVPIHKTCSAGSARGLGNPKSTLGYGRQIRGWFTRIEKFIRAGVPCFFKFGQVDTEYTFIYHWSKTGFPEFNRAEFLNHAEETVLRYLDFLKELVPPDLRSKICICSLNAPTISDEAWADGTFQKHIRGSIPSDEQDSAAKAIAKLHFPNLQERTTLHQAFNGILAREAEANGFGFIDVLSPFLRPDGKQVNEIFHRQGGGKDVHLDMDEPAMQVLEGILAQRMPAFDISSLRGNLFNDAKNPAKKHGDLKATVISKAWCLERPNGDVRSRYVRFNSNAQIEGYQHANETFWEIRDGRLVFRRNDGRITSVSGDLVLGEDSRILIHMMRADDQSAGAHRLREVERLEPDAFCRPSPA